MSAKFHPAEDLLESATAAFYKLRKLPDINKKPSTADLLDWIQALLIGGVPADKRMRCSPHWRKPLKKTEDLQRAGY